MPQIIFPWQNPKGNREAAQTSNSYAANSATSATTIAAAQLTGGAVGVVLAMTGALAAGAVATTDTAANIIAAIPVAQRYNGATYRLRVINESSGAFAWTIAGGTGVTVNGTATVAQNAWRDFIVTLTNVATGSQAVALQSIGTGSNS